MPKHYDFYSTFQEALYRAAELNQFKEIAYIGLSEGIAAWCVSWYEMGELIDVYI